MTEIDFVRHLKNLQSTGDEHVQRETRLGRDRRRRNLRAFSPLKKAGQHVYYFGRPGNNAGPVGTFECRPRSKRFMDGSRWSDLL